MLFSKSTFIALSQDMKSFKITSYLSSFLCVCNRLFVPIYYHYILSKKIKTLILASVLKRLLFQGKFYKLSPQRDFSILCIGI